MAESSERRFSRRQWARRLAGWRTALALLLVATGVGAGVWLVGWSSVLAVHGVTVEGAGRVVTDERIRETAEVPEGRPLARVDLDRIRARVESLAAVQEADVSREWPDRILVSITERRAVALVEIGREVRGMDAEGVAFHSYDGDAPALPRVRTDASVSADALREAAEVVTAMPSDLAGRVDSVTVETVDEITLQLRDGRTVRWGSAESSEEKSRVLAGLLDLDALSYDVSVPSRPVRCPVASCADAAPTTR